MSDIDYRDNTKARIELLGFPNMLTSFPQFVSAPRAGMFNHHISQAMVIDHPEFNKIFTGDEHKFIEYTINESKRNQRCEILGLFPKYLPPLVKREDCPVFYVVVMTMPDHGEGELDYFEIHRYSVGSNNFGYKNILENMEQIQPGNIIDKDTPFAHSANVQGNKYGPGVNLNTIYGSFPETIEDAFVISESAAKKLQTLQVSQVVLNCRMDRQPLNINGDQYEYKFLPDIGSTVREDGLMYADRPVHWTTSLADTDPVALREYLPLQDNPVYVEPGSRIIDITFNINNNKIAKNYEQATLYEKNNLKCWESIYSLYLKNKGKKLSPKMNTLVKTAIYRMIAGRSYSPSLDSEFKKFVRKAEVEGTGSNGFVVDFIQIIVTYAVPRLVSNGSKISDFYGSKGVVGAVRPDDCMPVDEFGIRADLMIDMNSPVSRNNPAQHYEVGINRISEFVRRQCKEVYDTRGAEPAFDLLMEWYRDVNPRYAQFIIDSIGNAQDKRRIVKEAIDTSPRIWIPPFLDTLTPSEDDQWNALVNIRNWAKKWGVKPSPVRYKIMQTDGSYREFVTETNFSIGSKYIIHLHKIPEITAPGVASVNHMGIPTKSTFDNKHFPVATNPYRYGEDELRVMVMDSPEEEVVRLQNLQSNSPEGTSIAIETLLLSEHPTCIKRFPVSTGDLLAKSAVLKLYHNTTAALGVETKHTRTNHFQVADEMENAIWDAELVSDDDDDSGAKRGGRRAKPKEQEIEIPTDTDVDEEDESED